MFDCIRNGFKIPTTSGLIEENNLTSVIQVIWDHYHTTVEMA